jgi:hypothetical protein
MAKLAGKKTITVNEMSQEIDLKRYLGRDATDREKRLFGELAVERINTRTLDGKTIHGTKFKKYSAEYAEKKGVTRDSVDLFLSGDMLDNVVAENANASKVRIEIDDSLDTKKGFNHNVGETVPKRQWFGITTQEARAMVEAVREDETAEEKESALRRIANQVTSTFTLAEIENELNKLDITLE